MMDRRTATPRFSISILFALVAFAVPTNAQAENVVRNPGFETVNCITTPNGTEPNLCAWHSWWEVARDTSNPHSGEASMLLACAPFCEIGVTNAFSGCTPIAPGEHPASFWYRSEPTELPLSVGLLVDYYYSRECGYPLPNSSYFGGQAIEDGGWHQVTGNLSAGPGTRYARFSLYAENGCEWCWFSVGFDDLGVEEAGLTPIAALAKEGEK